MYTGRTIEETRQAVSGDIHGGLTEQEARERLLRNGRNELRSARRKSLLEAFLEQLRDPLIYVLIGAAGVSVFLREISDAVIIGAVILLNAAVGLAQEGKAKKALDSLKKLTAPHALVVREGMKREIPAAELVVGDLVCLEAGCQVPADLRLVKSSNLKVEESALTGESLPMEKDARFLARNGRYSSVGLPGEGEEAIPLGDRRNMVYMSTIVTSGRGEGLVTAAGMDTELGRIAALISESGEELTPLQKRLGDLGKVLSILSLALCAFLFGIAVLQHRNIPDMLVTAISLAVAAVPEGLPAVVTICLALSVTRMVRVNTIIRRLPSVETLGAVSVVCSDKTGTLTRNKMTVERCFLDLREYEKGGNSWPFFSAASASPASQGHLASREHSASQGHLASREHSVPQKFPASQEHFLRAMTLCNDGAEEAGSRVGDPTELALLDLAAEFGFSRSELEKRFPRFAELSFDSDRKMMTTCHRQFAGGNSADIAYTKGAPERVLERCDRILLHGRVQELTSYQRRQILEEVKALSTEALRTLAFAMKPLENSGTRGGGERFPDGSFPTGEISGDFQGGTPTPQLEKNLIFLGLAGMRDPLRPEAKEAVHTFQKAGVKTVMITGDHGDTACAIGRSLHILEDPSQCMTGPELDACGEEEFLERLDRVRVFARVSPAQKVRIVKGFQKKGEIVAMTGDGVNDAPSLKAADIGIAMGQAGTDVARQASDMILTDDNFATIEKAIEEGRGVYENIRKTVIFLLSSNLGEILTMFAAVLAGIASPLKSSHILWINLITDSLPALALGADPNDGKSLMEHSPRRPGESLFARGGLACTCFYGLLIAMISLTAFLLVPFTVLKLEGWCPPLPVGAGMGSGWLANLGIFRLPGILSALLREISSVLGREGILNRAQTYAFTVLGMSQLFHAVGMRDVHRSVFRRGILENRLMLLAGALGFALQFAVTELPFLIGPFGTSHLTLKEWLLLLLLAAFPLLAHEILVMLHALRNLSSLSCHSAETVLK